MSALAGKVVIVTGAGRGIGRALALAAAAEGAKVLVADRGASLIGESPDGSVADAVVAEIIAGGGEALASAETVASMDGARNIVGAALDAWGAVDGLVCCAGILRHRPFLELTEDDFDAVIGTHLKGHFSMFQAALRAMVDVGRGGSLIGISSAYVQGDPARAPYRAAKAGIIALTKSAAMAGAPYGVRANVISPVANTRMTEAANLHFDSDPEDIAPMAVFLLSDQSVGINGEVYTVQGHTITSWKEPEQRRAVRNPARWAQAELAAAMPWLREGGGVALPPMPPLPEQPEQS